MHQVALLGFAAALDQLAEQRHLVPMGVRHPLAILLAVVVGGDVHLRHLVVLRDLAHPADAPKLRDILLSTVLSIDQAHSCWELKGSDAAGTKLKKEGYT